MTTRGTTFPGGRAAGAFTLIELLVVISIIGIVSAMVLNLSALAGRKKRDSVVTADKNKLILMIASYYAKMGYYPPDNGRLITLGMQTTNNYATLSIQNQLYYELTGAPLTNSGGTNGGGTNGFLTFDGGILTPADVNGRFHRGGFANSHPTRPQHFFKPGPSPKEIDNYQKANPPIYLLTVPVPQTNNQPNYWHYDSSTPLRHNPDSYDLWAEYPAGAGPNGTTLIVTNGNW